MEGDVREAHGIVRKSYAIEIYGLPWMSIKELGTACRAFGVKLPSWGGDLALTAFVCEPRWQYRLGSVYFSRFYADFLFGLLND